MGNHPWKSLRSRMEQEAALRGYETVEMMIAGERDICTAVELGRRDRRDGCAGNPFRPSKISINHCAWAYGYARKGR